MQQNIALWLFNLMPLARIQSYDFMRDQHSFRRNVTQNLQHARPTKCTNALELFYGVMRTDQLQRRNNNTYVDVEDHLNLLVLERTDVILFLGYIYITKFFRA